MSKNAWIRDFRLVGWLLLVFGAPCALAAETAGHPPDPEMSPEARMLGALGDLAPPADPWFEPDPTYDEPYDAEEELEIYAGKHMNRTARPPVQLGRRLYDRGAYEPRPTWLGAKNPIGFHLMAYGDLRVAAAYNDTGAPPVDGETEQTRIATRLNLDLDMAITATERIHAFIRPFDQGGSFTRYEIGGRVEDEFVEEFDLEIETLFFEGDVGAILRGWTGETQRFDLPITFGRVPLLTQNGIWIEDTFDGLAVGITANNSAKLGISNYDLTFFAGFNEVTTDAVPGNDDSNLFGLAGFVDVFDGYVEFGYAYVDAGLSGLSYHNATASFSKRYQGRVANSVRLIGNFGQDGRSGTKTADGVLLLVENSFLPRLIPPIFPNVTEQNLVPYLNLFAGFDTPQSLARAAGSGGVLRNTGINFETDGLTGYPTLDARGHDSWGGAAGVEYLFQLDRQIVFEAAVVERMGSSPLGSEYALGMRYQHPITNAWIVRFDAMHGWRDGRRDVFGIRLELRRKL